MHGSVNNPQVIYRSRAAEQDGSAKLQTGNLGKAPADPETVPVRSRKLEPVTGGEPGGGGVRSDPWGAESCQGLRPGPDTIT